MKKILTIILSFILILAMSVSAYAATITYQDKEGKTYKISDFRDTKGHWAHDVILKWADYNIVAGDNGNFMPNNPIKRGDLCVILDRMLGLYDISYNYFYDLPNDTYYSQSVLRCVAAGYVSGTSATTVDAKGNATREQVATIIFRMFDLDSSGYNSVRKFSDDYNIGSWAREAVYTMRKYGYMNGDGSNNFNPRANITRAEFIQVMNNVAGSFIPKTDSTGEGVSFTNTFTGNVMVARGITLTNSVIPNDLILTQSSNSIQLYNSSVGGRLFVMGKNVQVNLKNDKINEIYLKGKATITGMDDNTDLLYVTENASESSVNVIPKRTILEPGARLEIKGTMYENNTNVNKEYIGTEIKNSIAEEQGYITGGPRIQGFDLVQDIYNTIKVTDLRVVAEPGSSIKEIGVVWIEEDENTDAINPTFKKNDGKKVYPNKNFSNILSFDVRENKEYSGYRIYAIDSNGLYGYSKTITFEPYDYNIDLNIYSDDYPKSVNAEVVLSGDNLPLIDNVQIIYGTDSEYNENRKIADAILYYNSTSETKIDNNKYRRYIKTINSETYWNKELSSSEYTPATHYGYILKFRDGTIINRYPVVSNVIPEGASPVSILNTGTAYYNKNYISINNNVVKSKYIAPQEVGVVYKVSNSEVIEKPLANESGWHCIPASISIGINESASYNIKINTSASNDYIQYAAYIKTSNGYWYGDVYCVSNNTSKDDNGYELVSANAEVFGDNEALISIQYEGEDISEDDYVSLGSSMGTYPISYFEHYILQSRKLVLIKVSNLSENTIYNSQIRIIKNTGEKSNIVSCPINTGNKVGLSLTNKTVGMSGNVIYTLSCTKGDNGIYVKNAYIKPSLKTLSTDYYDRKVTISNSDITNGCVVNVTFEYYIQRNNSGYIFFTFNRDLPVY